MPPGVKLTLLKIISAELVPTEPDRITLSAPSKILKAPAVPVFVVLVSEVIALAEASPVVLAGVPLPLPAPQKDGLLSAKVANTVPKDAGVPVPISRLPPPLALNRAVTASTAAFLADPESMRAIQKLLAGNNNIPQFDSKVIGT